MHCTIITGFPKRNQNASRQNDEAMKHMRNVPMYETVLNFVWTRLTCSGVYRVVIATCQRMLNAYSASFDSAFDLAVPRIIHHNNGQLADRAISYGNRQRRNFSIICCCCCCWRCDCLAWCDYSL